MLLILLIGVCTYLRTTHVQAVKKRDLSLAAERRNSELSRNRVVIVSYTKVSLIALYLFSDKQILNYHKPKLVAMLEQLLKDN